MKPPHILVLPASLECKWSKGGTFYIEQAEIMRKFANWQIRLLLPCVHHIAKIKKSNFPPAAGVEVEERDGIEIWLGYYSYWLPRRPMRAKINFGEKLFLQYAKKHGKPDFLWVQGIPPAGYLARHLRQKYGIPYFVREHSATYGQKTIKPPVARRISEVIGDSVYCAAVSGAARADMLRQLPAVAPEKIGVIHNPLGLTFSEAAPAPRKQNPVTFISTAYLRGGKNINNIIAAFAEVHSQTPNCRLLLVGDGEQKTALIKQVADLGISKAVTFAGHQGREQTRDHLRAADIFISASGYETFGLALVEALACGLPVITAKTGISGEIVNDKNGVLIESPAAENIAAAMRRAMAEQYDSAAIQQTARQNFLPEIFARRILQNLPV